MEDASRDRVIDRIVHSVFSGIDWGSQQVKSSCPPRERWSWKKFWNWIQKFEKKKDELEIQRDDQETYERFFQSKEARNIEMSIEDNKLSRCGYQFCEIKMQDPCTPCCCTIECIEPPPCTEIPRIDRTPRCDCAKRKVIKIGQKCCDPASFEIA